MPIRVHYLSVDVRIFLPQETFELTIVELYDSIHNRVERFKKMFKLYSSELRIDV